MELEKGKARGREKGRKAKGRKAKCRKVKGRKAKGRNAKDRKPKGRKAKEEEAESWAEMALTYRIASKRLLAEFAGECTEL